MKYYKDTKGNVFAYEDDVDEDLIKPGLMPMTEQEVHAHINSASPSVSDLLEIAKSELRATRRDILDAVTGIGFRANVAGNTELAQEASAVSQQLLDITDDPALNAATTYEAMQSAGVMAYKRIAGTASPELGVVFREITGA